MITCQRPRSRPAESLLSDSNPSIPQICIVCQAITVKSVKGKRADLLKKKMDFWDDFINQIYTILSSGMVSLFSQIGLCLINMNSKFM